MPSFCRIDSEAEISLLLPSREGSYEEIIRIEKTLFAFATLDRAPV